MDGGAHGVNGHGGVAPDFEGAGALVDEHGKAVGSGDAEGAGLREERGFGRVVDHVVNAGGTGAGGECGEIDGERVGGFEAGAGGVDDEGIGGHGPLAHARSYVGMGEGVERDAVGERGELREEGVEIGAGAVDEGEAGAAALETFDGGSAGGSTGAVGGRLPSSVRKESVGTAPQPSSSATHSSPTSSTRMPT